MSPPEPRLYSELAPWWPLFSHPDEYAEEATSFVEILALPAGERRPRMLELGSGGGNLASHLKAHFDITLCDRSPGMLAVSRELNPELEHIEGDMCSVRLEREFDVVLIHDAIMYCTEADSVRSAIETAARHCRAGGSVLVAPDFVRESYEPRTDCGGTDAADGRGVRYLEWLSDADPDDHRVEALYAIVLREASGETRVELDHHVVGSFEEADWLAWFREAGLAPRVVVDAWKRHVFVGVKRA